MAFWLDLCDLSLFTTQVMKYTNIGGRLTEVNKLQEKAGSLNILTDYRLKKTRKTAETYLVNVVKQSDILNYI